MGTQLETMLTQRGVEGQFLLATAALDGEKASFDAVLEAVRTRSTPDQVLRRSAFVASKTILKKRGYIALPAFRTRTAWHDGEVFTT